MTAKAVTKSSMSEITQPAESGAERTGNEERTGSFPPATPTGLLPGVGTPLQSAVTVTIPFATLKPDNAKYGVIRGRMLLRAEYRAAKDTIQHIARRAMNRAQPFEGEVELHARLYVPDRRRRDAQNYSKLCCDSLQGSVYLDDTQIKKATWEHCGIDRENPRVEITVRRRVA